MRFWEGLVLFGTIVFILIAVVGLIQVQRRLKARERLRLELARVVSEFGEGGVGEGARARDAGPSGTASSDADAAASSPDDLSSGEGPTP